MPDSQEPAQPLKPTLVRDENPVKRFFKMLGPGLITGASDDDPSGIATYATAGAALGFATLWTAILTFPMMVAVEYVCAKVGLVTGAGLANAIKKNYSQKVLYPVLLALLIANTINAGTDIGAIAAALNLLIPVPTILMIVPIAVVIIVLQIWISYRRIAKIFKWLTLTLFAYIFSTVLAAPHWSEVIRATFIPPLRFDRDYLLTLVAILGTTISPYLFFWQASEEVEEEVSIGRRTLRQRKGATDEELRTAKWDVAAGMIFCNLIFYFVIVGTAATLHVAGKTDISSAADAAQALRPLAGNSAGVLFALGIVGAGFLAVPVLTGATGYAIAETFNWKYGLNEKLARAKHFYASIAASTLIGMLVNFAGINPVRALFWTAVINGFLSPPLVVLIMLLANNRHVMGNRVNRRGTNIVGWSTVVVMFAAAIAAAVAAVK
jgi:NRAMP (natural resistance-associated macrophage protein)-like metal ion transporter